MNLLSRPLVRNFRPIRKNIISFDVWRNLSDIQKDESYDVLPDNDASEISKCELDVSANGPGYISRRNKIRKLSSGGDNIVDKPQTLKLPILEMRDHIMPKFEKLFRRNDSLQILLDNVEPRVKKFGYFIQRDGHKFQNDLSHLYDIGTLASYEYMPSAVSEAPYILIKSHQRVKRLNVEPEEDIITSQNELKLKYALCQTIIDEKVHTTPEIRTLCYQIIDSVRKLQTHFPCNSVLTELSAKFLNPLFWSYCSSDFSRPSESDRLQSVLEEDDLVERLKKTTKTLQEEVHFFSILSQINQKINEGDLRESYLYNLSRLKSFVDQAINQFNNANKPGETGRGSSPFYSCGSKTESSFEKKIKDRLKDLVLPPHVQTVVNEELGRISALDKSSIEYGLIQSYLDNLTLVPWGVYSGGDTKLVHARDILNEDHYGLEDVKSTILEHLAVSSRLEKIKGRILCFVGPPGVGKTSIAKSIARALNRKYVRISVGGIDDSCEIKGHRRTYVGALPGKIIKGLQLARSMDPVFCIDEIDKMVRSHRGDPNGSLLEVFDPEQNNTFTDLFLDLPCDLSRVLFVCTANSTKNMSQPLLDRMDIIRVSGYTCEEKLNIINNYLVPLIVKSFNLQDLYNRDIIVDPDVFQRLTNEYFLEAGIRKTKNCIEKMFRKAIMSIDIGDRSSVHITASNMTDFAGYPDQNIRIPEECGVVGIVTGLSASESYATGFTLDIECDFVKKSKKSDDQIKPTGLAGKSLSESSSVAFAVAKKVLAQIDPDNNAFEENEVRVHFLEGGIQKDGPSAGVAIFSAVMSQALNIPVSRGIAMTGEITLKGKVLAVGGIKEKVTAAIRVGIGRVILPSENVSNYKQLSEEIKSKVDITFVSNVQDLMDAVFPSLTNYKDKSNVSNQTTN